MTSHTHLRGFTVMEVLTAIAIVFILATVSLSAFRNFRDYFALRTATRDVHSALIDARMATLASKNDTVHGVHIASDSVTRFEGASYSAGASSNVVIPFSYGVTAAPALAGGGSDVVFTRLSGDTTQSGTITLTEPRSGDTNVITIHTSGSIDI